MPGIRWVASVVAGVALTLSSHTLAVTLTAQADPAAATPAAAAPSADLQDVDPIRCWWRTSANAVRIGEPFSLLLTCAVVDNASTTVVADQSKLEPAALQIQPFEVLSGQRGPDLHSDQRRFFQYQYSLRLLSEDLFGKDAKIPPVQIDYYLQSRVAQGESVRGRDQIYNLPTESVRVLSLVPVDASDIRDAASLTFDDIDAERSRARVLQIGAVVLTTAGALVVIVALVRLARQRRDETLVSRPLLSDASLLRAAGRELRTVRRQRQRDGWTDDLVGRALASVRIVGSIALSTRVSQQAAGERRSHGGQLELRGGALWTKIVHVSGAATPETVGKELAGNPAIRGRRRAYLTGLQTALARLTVAQFGREATRDDLALDESVSDALSALRRLQIDCLWPVKKIRNAASFALGWGNRAWSR